jgi:hypothetical protein
MKAVRIFVPVFAAILAAAVIIFLFVGAKSRLDNWEKAKNAYLTAIDSLGHVDQETSDAVNSGNLEQVTAALKTLGKAQTEIKTAEQHLVIILEHKPFFLPLTQDEQKLLVDLKASLQPKPTPVPIPTVNAETTPEPTASVSETVQEESQSIVGADETSTPSPPFIRLIKPVTVQGANGAITLEAGLSVPFVSRAGDNVRFHYGDTEYEIPVDATELAK